MHSLSLARSEQKKQIPRSACLPCLPRLRQTGAGQLGMKSRRYCLCFLQLHDVRDRGGEPVPIPGFFFQLSPPEPR